MTAFKASDILIKIGDGQPSEQFTLMGGLQEVELRVRNELVRSDTLSSGAWRALNEEAGHQLVRISGVGLFTENVAEESVRAAVLANTGHNYQFCFPQGSLLQGSFLIEEYRRGGNVAGEEESRITWENAGVISYIA